MGLSRKSRLAAAAAILACGGGVVWFESHHAIPGFRAWTFACVALAIAIGTGLARGRGRDALLVATTIGVCLCVLEVAASLLQPRGDLSVSPFGIALKPEVGFGFNQQGVIHARKRDPKTHAVIFEADYTIGNTLDRKVASAESGPATVFFGDSFTFGEGLADADTMPQKYADLFAGQRRVLNLAVTGYSPQQFLMEVQRGLRDDVIGPRPAAFVFLTSPFHAMRTACKETWTPRAPRYALVDGGPVFQGVCDRGASLAVHEFLENTALYRVAIRPYAVRLTHADIDLYIRILAEAVRISKERYGVTTLVPFVDSLPGYLAGTGYDDAAVIAALRAQGVWVVDMTLPDASATGAPYAIAGDGHPTGAANAARAQMIADALVKVGSQTAAGP